MIFFLILLIRHSSKVNGEEIMSLLNKASMDGFEKALLARESEGGMDTYENLKTKGRGLASKTDSGIRSLSVDIEDPASNLSVVDRFGKYKELTEKARANRGSLIASNQSLKEQIEATEQAEVTGNTVYSFIAQQEQFRANAYPDGPNRYSIGYGTKSSKGKTITEKEAYDLMVKEVNKAMNTVEEFNNKYSLKLTENQKDALTSFTYNSGRQNLIKLLAKGKRNKDEIANSLKLYNQQDGKVLQGLVDRREAEFNLFTTGYEQ